MYKITSKDDGSLKSHCRDYGSLKSICRDVILKNVNYTKRSDSVNKLNIPNCLRNYLFPL